MEKEEFVFCITDNSPDAIVFSAQGLIRYLNPAAVALFGAESSASLIGQPFLERVHPDYRDLSDERIRLIDQSGARNPLLEQTYQRLDGSPLRVEVASIPFHGSTGPGALIFIRDISDLKQAQSDLARSQGLLDAIIDNTPAVIFVKDTAGRYLLVNQRYSDLHHVSNDELRGRTDFDLFPPEVAAAVRDADNAVLADGVAREFEEAIPMDDGPHTMLALKFPLRDVSGEVYAVCGVATDITERKRSEAALKELYQNLEQRVAERTEELRAAEERLREAIALNANILATSTVGVMAYRQDGQCVLANPAAAELIGGSQDQLLAQNLYRIDSWRRAGLLDLAAAAASEGRRMEMETRFTSGFGKDVWVRAQVSPFFSGNEPHLLLVLHDITEQRSATEALSERERAFRSLADNVPDNIARWNCNGELIYLNRTLEQTLGITQAEIQGRTTAELWPDGRFDLLLSAVRWVAASGESRDFDQIVPGPDGLVRYHMIRMVPETDPEGHIVSVLGVGRDLTDQKRTEEQLRLAASVFHSSAEGVLITDTDGIILSVNPAFTKITGYPEDEAVGQRPSLLRSQHHRAEFYGEMWHILHSQGHWQGEIWNRRKGGEVYLQWMTINRIDDEDGNAVRYVSVFHDITEMRRKDERIHHLAFHDALTGLPNRALMLDRLQHAINRCQRESGRLSVTFIDLDRFKSVNDGLGHDIGDLLLQEVAQRIEGRLRAMDTVARLGGDEFVVLMEDLGEAGQCANLAEQLIAAIRAPMQLRGHSVEIGASMGMAFFPEDGDDPLELMKRADMAMYAAKAAGRNTYRFFQEDMLQRTTHRLNLEMELRRAISCGNLELHYQPKLALASGKVVGVEALVRWRHPERGLLPPGDFIPLAEDSGLIVELGNWVLDAACRQAAIWHSQGWRLPIAVNISARQLEAGNLVEHISTLVARHGIATNDLEIELTESTVMSNPASVAELLGRLRALGVTVAVDDFGTGYSSLAYLRRLPIDVLKIDRSFVMDADQNDEDAQIVRTIVALGQALRLTLVAEGIENQRQADLLLGLGCDIAQGYHYSPPLPAADLARWLERGG